MGGSIMAQRNHKDWLKQPKMDYISSECYNNYQIFEEEQKAKLQEMKLYHK